MRITINLATRPFVELQPLFARLRTIVALLALVAVGLGAALYIFSRRERTAQDEMDALARQTQAFQQERAANEARMRQPENRGVLERAQFLNGVFAQKAFSWTSVMMDLEHVLPAGVQVTSIAPDVAADGEVSIHMRVNGPRDLEVDLMRNLEHSQRFLAPRLATETAQMQESGRVVPVAQIGVAGGVEFDILSGYNPLPVVKEIAKPAAAAKSAIPGGPLMPVTRLGPPKRVSPAAAPNGANAKTNASVPAPGSAQPMPPGNQIPQPMRPAGPSGGSR